MKNILYCIAVFVGLFSKIQAQSTQNLTGFAGAQALVAKTSSPAAFVYGKYFIDEEEKDLGFWTLAGGSLSSLSLQSLMNQGGSDYSSYASNPLFEIYAGGSYAFKFGKRKLFTAELGAGSRAEMYGNQFQTFLSYVSVTKKAKLSDKKFKALFGVVSDGRYLGFAHFPIGKKLSMGIQMQSNAWGAGFWYKYKSFSAWGIPSYVRETETFGALVGASITF